MRLTVRPESDPTTNEDGAHTYTNSAELRKDGLEPEGAELNPRSVKAGPDALGRQEGLRCPE